ncbi:MAG: RDD family protein [Deltaproteobacteria bacterium]|nr:RDD family protein [Deltaproteobacteria bacterium]
MTETAFAGFWRRLAAYIIDKIILYFLYLFILLVGIAALPHGLPLNSQRLPINTIMDIGLEFAVSYCVAVGLINMLYFTYFHGYGGQTPGKMMLRIKVIKVAGGKITPGAAFLRWVGYLISGAVLYLGFLWVLIDTRKQGWHDKIAGTFVVHAVAEAPDGVQLDRFGFNQKIP